MAEIKDSGERREFETGAVRDIQEGKGRCDLLPLDVVCSLMDTSENAAVLYHIGEYMHSGHDMELYRSITAFNEVRGWTTIESILEVSKHYEAGAAKYGERNWEQGIPVHSYIDSGVRHFLKFVKGEDDERHDRAFVWNMLGAIWTAKHHPELIDVPFNLLGCSFPAGRNADDSEARCDDVDANIHPDEVEVVDSCAGNRDIPVEDMVSLPREFLNALMQNVPVEEVK